MIGRAIFRHYKNDALQDSVVNLEQTEMIMVLLQIFLGCLFITGIKTKSIHNATQQDDDINFLKKEVESLNERLTNVTKQLQHGK